MDADKKRFVWSSLNVGDKSAVSPFEVPAVDVQYYLKTLKKAGYLDASLLGNGDVTYVSLALSGHDRIEQLRRMTLQARSGRAVAAILRLTVLSVGLPIITSVLTFLVMRSLGE